MKVLQNSHNKPQQSLPLVARTAKTLRLFVCPCAGRYKYGYYNEIYRINFHATN